MDASIARGQIPFVYWRVEIEKTVQQKVGSPDHIPATLVLLEIAALAAIHKKPSWAEADYAVLVAASKAVRKVMKDHGFHLAPPQASLMARFWVFDINVIWEPLEAQNSVPAVMDNWLDCTEAAIGAQKPLC